MLGQKSKFLQQVFSCTCISASVKTLLAFPRANRCNRTSCEALRSRVGFPWFIRPVERPTASRISLLIVRLVRCGGGGRTESAER